MRKTDKKIDNQIRAALTDVCDTALEEFDGFQWLTHLVNYSNFPKSLRVVCVFDTNENLDSFMATTNSDILSTLMQKKLLGVDVTINDMASHIHYDTEENCDKNHSGKWADRLARVAT